MASIHTVFGLATNFDLQIEQMDVKTVFLHDDLEEEIHMKKLGGFALTGKEDNVCKSKKFSAG